jgi:hypothetical protein
MEDIKYYLLVGLGIIITLVIIVVNVTLYFNNLDKNRLETFTSSLPDNLDSQPWPINQDIGFMPLIVSDIDGHKLPVLKLGVSYPGSISYLVGQYFQRKIYPVKLEIQPSTMTILAELNATPGQSSIIDLGFIREPQLLELSRTDLGIQNISVLAPAYWETIYMVGNKYTTFASLAELKRVRPISENLVQQNIASQRVGVLRDGLIYWEAIIRALDLEIGRDFLKAENDNLAELLAQLERRELDAVFLIGHTFDARLQAFLKTNETRMISIFPLSPYPQDTDMLIKPYNPETTNIIAKFRADMKVYIPWIFDETVSLGKPVGNKRQLTTSNLGSGTSVYKTFKVRSYLCCNRQLGRNKGLINQLGTRYLEQYQTMRLLIQEWVLGSKTTQKSNELQPKQLTLPTLVFADYDSFNPDLLGAIPTEIEINPFMRELIANIYGRIKIESLEPSCDI